MCNYLYSETVLWSVGWWWKEERRWNPMPAHSLLLSKSTKGRPGITSPCPTDESLSTVKYAFSTYVLRKSLEFNPALMYSLAIRNCTSPPLLAPRLKIFKWKFTTSPEIEPRNLWTRGRHATIWASAAGLLLLLLLILLLLLLLMWKHL